MRCLSWKTLRETIILLWGGGYGVHCFSDLSFEYVTNFMMMFWGAYEQVVEKVNAAVLTDKVALHVEALKTFVDRFGQERKTGECWLLTNQLTETFIPSVNEKIVKKIPYILKITWCLRRLRQGGFWLIFYFRGYNPYNSTCPHS